MKITTMVGIEPQGTVREFSWDSFVRYVKSQSKPVRDEAGGKKLSPSFSCVEFAGGYRGKKNIVGKMCAVALDFDNVESGKELIARFRGYRYIAWTTWSSTVDRERWRIVLPVAGGFDPESLGGYVDEIERRFGVRVDKCSRDAAHLWFLPHHRASNAEHHRVISMDGREYRSNRLRLDFSDVPGSTHTTVDGEGRSPRLFHEATRRAPQCEDVEALIEEMWEWNNRYLAPPLGRREFRRQVKNAWGASLKNSLSLRRRAKNVEGASASEFRFVEGWKPMAKDPIRVVKPLVGNFLWPGATILSAKLKEGKSYLCAQLACSLATGQPFLTGLNGAGWAGFGVTKPVDVIMVAGEDDEALLDDRLKKKWRNGQLPNAEGHIQIYLVDHLMQIREANPEVEGLALLEKLMQCWYERGYRVFFFDPLTVLEVGLGITEYPGAKGRRNLHQLDFLITFYYNDLAKRFPGVSIVLSMHHGKNKSGHDASDPNDMIAATSGLGAGAAGTIAILPVGKSDKEEDEDDNDEEERGRRRELYFLGRRTPQQRLLIEQQSTGLWKCLGPVEDSSGQRQPIVGLTSYIRTLWKLGGAERPVSGALLARELKKAYPTIAVRMGEVIKAGLLYNGLRVVSERGPKGGYRLISGEETGSL